MSERVRRGSTRLVRPWLRRVALWVGPLLILILLWQVWDGHERSRLAAQADDLRNDMAEPDLDGQPDGGEDAGSRYLAALFVRHVPPESYSLMTAVRDAVSRGMEVPPARLSQLSAMVVRNEAALRLIDEAAALPFAPLDAWERDVAFRMALPTTALDTTASLRTLEHLAHGDAGAAVASLLSRLRILRVLDADRYVLRAMFKDAAVTAIATDLQLVLGQAEADVPIMRLEELADALDTVYVADELARTIRREALAIYENGSAIWGPRAIDAGTLLPVRPLLRRQVGIVVRAGREAAGAARQPWPQRIAAISQLQSQRSWVADAVERLYPGLAPWEFVDAWQRHARGFARATALVNAARVAITVERHRREHDVLPSISDLGMNADATMDPFSGESLRMRVGGDSYVVYSVGEDGRDDGGDVQPERPVHLGPIARVEAPDVGVTIRVR